MNNKENFCYNCKNNQCESFPYCEDNYKKLEVNKDEQ